MLSFHVNPRLVRRAHGGQAGAWHLHRVEAAEELPAGGSAAVIFTVRRRALPLRAFAAAGKRRPVSLSAV